MNTEEFIFNLRAFPPCFRFDICYAYNSPILYQDYTGHWSEINWKINTQKVVHNITNWALNATGLSDQGYTSVVDVVAGATLVKNGGRGEKKSTGKKYNRAIENSLQKSHNSEDTGD